ncbi:murein biosynthesis integral membrane protein MurJ [Streptantibioticus parmotrematis]|nr:murein biosynthesis integral membrane protein MurJ [Streptantibioticus parmotrematis]
MTNAPYDEERDRAASYDDASAATPPPPPDPRAVPDPYLQGPYAQRQEQYAPQEPYAANPYAQQPSSYGQQSGPAYGGQPAPDYDGPAPQNYGEQPPAYGQQPYPPQGYGEAQPSYAPDQVYDQTQEQAYPPPVYHQPPQQPYPTSYGEQPAPGDQGVQGGYGDPGAADPYAHLFRDQGDDATRQLHATAPAGPATDGSVPRPPMPQPPPGAAGQPQEDPVPLPQEPAEPAEPASSGGGKIGNLMKSSALMAAGTLVSRLTGFLRNLVVAAAIGVSTLNDSYQIANTLPTMIYILVGGGALNSVFIPQLTRAMKNDDDGGEAYANRLLTLVVVGLAGVTAVMVIGAPLLVRLMSPDIASHPASMQVTVAFTRYCLPTIFFSGVYVVLGQILNARGRFGAMMWTPVLNNIVIIAAFGGFIWVYGGAHTSGVDVTTISPEGVRLLGIGTLLGLVVQALAMIPYLRETGMRIRPRFDWRGHGLGHAAKLAKWTFFFVLANQVGLIVVTQLSTAAGLTATNQGHPGAGFAGYQYALQLWQMPQAIITVSVMTAILPRISRAAADGDVSAVRDDLSYGLRTSAVAIVPCAFAFLALGVPLSTLMYSSSGEAGAQNIGYILMAFGLGLIPFSVQYVVLRGFYAYEDTRTPFYNTVIVATVNAVASALCFVVLPARWAVTGMAASYGLAYLVGVGVAVKRLRNRIGGDLDGARVMRTYARLIGASLPAALVGGAAAFGITGVLGYGFTGSLAAVVGGGVVLLAVFYVAARRMRIEEMTAMVGMVRGRLGR